MPGRIDGWLTAARRSRLEAGAWGALIALNTAFVSLLLISRGAGTTHLAIYASGASLFGLGAGVIGPWAAARTGGAIPVMAAAIGAGRLGLAAAPLLLLFTNDGAVPLLIAALLLWSAGEGIAQPLWIAHLASLSEPSERRGRISARATAAAVGAACVMLPLAAIARQLPTDRALLAAYGVALAAAGVSAWQMSVLLRIRPPSGGPERTRASPGGGSVPGFWFLGGVFAFWFGAALNRPVLPPYVVDELHAPAAYFATAAVVAAVAGAGLQPRWGRLAARRGARALLGWSGLAAGIVPLLWAIVPDYRYGIPVEMLASTCWLAHLLGVNLHVVEITADDAHRASVLARTQLVQGAAAACAPLAAASVVGIIGTAPILAASGVVCLGATAIMAGFVPGSSRLPASLEDAAVRVRAHAGLRWPTVIAAFRASPAASAPMRASLPRPQTPASWLPMRRLPLATLRALSADCPSCAGIGCGVCFGSGLG